MTIVREYYMGPFVVQCDTCLDTEELEGTTIIHASHDARERGYRPKVIGGVWKHICKGCPDIGDQRGRAVHAEPDQKHALDQGAFTRG